MSILKKFGLIGYPLGHSFSKKYYTEKIRAENIHGIEYDLYPIEDIDLFTSLYQEDICFEGFNVTIPYKQSIMPFLDDVSSEAKEIGAVNCIKIIRNTSGERQLYGFNTDSYGFEQSLLPQLNQRLHTNALILGNGGAAKAVVYVLKKLGIPTQIVSRTKSDNTITYQELTEQKIYESKLIINCSPVGTFPNVEQCPDLPYDAIGPDHYFYDLIYNPTETLFLKNGRERGAQTKNGYDMLILQAERNWKIWLD